jgi:hypothetical protein
LERTDDPYYGKHSGSGPEDNPVPETVISCLLMEELAVINTFCEKRSPESSGKSRRGIEAR